MRVTLVTGEYPPMRGGVADYTALLATHLVRLGVEVSVLTSIRAASGATREGIAVDPSVKAWGTSLWANAARHLARFRPDVVNVQYQTGAFDMKLGVNLLPWIQRFRRRRPAFVVTFHDLKEPYLLPKLGPARHLATILLAQGADGIVVTNPEDHARVVGPSGGERARWSWGRRPIAAIAIGSNVPSVSATYDRAEWRARLGARDDELLVAFFGFLGPSKGVDVLVASFEDLVRRGAPVRLLMLGASSGDSSYPDRSYERAIRHRLDQPLVRGRVTWTGFLSAADVAAHLGAADVCCLPFRDGFSIRHGTLVAAITHGLPIVTTERAVGGSFEQLPTLRHGENALLVPPGDSAALASAVEQLLRDPALRTRLARGAATLAPAFAWETIAHQTLEFYRRVDRRA